MDNCPQSTSGMGQQGTFAFERNENSRRVIYNPIVIYNTSVDYDWQTLLRQAQAKDRRDSYGDRYVYICDNNGLICPIRTSHPLKFFHSETFKVVELIRAKKSRDEWEQRRRAQEDALKRSEEWESKRWEEYNRQQIRQQEIAKEIQIRQHERKNGIKEEAEVGNQANGTNDADTSQEQAQNVEQNREEADVDNPVELAAPVSRRARRASVLPRRRISMRLNVPRTRSGHKRI